MVSEESIEAPTAGGARPVDDVQDAVPRAVSLPAYTGPMEARVPEGGTNVLAVVSMVLGIVPVLFGLVGVILGFVALDQLKARGQNGRGYALTGIISGFVWVAVGVAALGSAALSHN